MENIFGNIVKAGTNRKPVESADSRRYRAGRGKSNNALFRAAEPLKRASVPIDTSARHPAGSVRRGRHLVDWCPAGRGRGIGERGLAPQARQAVGVGGAAEAVGGTAG